MSRLKLFFLGSPQIKLDDEMLEIELRKGVALLAYLAVTGQSHSRDTLSTLLWPDSDQSKARSYLRHALWLLKKVLGDSWLEVSREQVGLKPEADIWLDVCAFQEGAASGEEAEDLTRLAGAVELYRDDFLWGFTLPDAPEFDEWQFFQTEEYRERLAGALKQLVWGYSQQRDYEAAISYGRRWVVLDPLHEPAQRHLMQLYGEAGQRHKALRQYQVCLEALAAAGAIPDPETEALYRQIMSGQIAPPPVSSPKPVWLPPAPIAVEMERSTPLAGRRAELVALQSRVRAARQGQGATLLLAGEAGVGKTRLAYETLRFAAMACFEQALALPSTPTWQPGFRARVQLHLLAVFALTTAGNLAAADQHLEAALAEVGEVGKESSEYAYLLYNVAMRHWHRHEYQEAFEAARHSLDIARRLDDAEAAVRAYEMLALTSHSLGNWQEGLRFEEQRLSLVGPGFDVTIAYDAHL